MEAQLERGMLSNPRDHRITRYLRLLIFSFVAAILLVSVLIVLISFLWDNFLISFIRYLWNYFTGSAPGLNPYSPRIEFIAPSVVLIALILAKIIWDAAEGKTGPTRSRKP